VAHPDDFIVPGAYVSSNITDFAKFAVALMKDQLVSSETFYEQILQRHIYVLLPDRLVDRGLGFNLEGLGNDILAYQKVSSR
jgi:hypothetical protein